MLPGMKLTHTSRVSQSTLVVLLAGAAILACDKPREETAKSAWNCEGVDVPMGEVVRCAQSALIIDEPAGEGEPCSGTADNPELCGDTTTSGETSYECTAGMPDCPSAEDGPTSTGDTSETEDSSTDGTSGTNAGDKGSSGTRGNGHGPSGRDFGSSGSHECAYVDDLPYCAGSETDGGTTDGTCTKGNCNAPGQKKKNDGGASSSSDDASADASSGSGSGHGPTHYKCKKDNKGNKTCESIPECAPGTHPSDCGACVDDGDTSDCVPPSEGGCWVTGGGFIVGPNVTTGAAPDGHDNFGGNAKPMKDGRIQGHWNHVDHGTGNHAKGTPEYIVCRHVDEPGPGQPGGKKGLTMNQVYIGGPAEWRSNDTWSTGYWFDVVAKDHGEPGSVPSAKNGSMPDTYHFTIRLMDDAANEVSGAIVYETAGSLEGGNIQMHAPNGGHPYTPMDLPSWVSFDP